MPVDRYENDEGLDVKEKQKKVQSRRNRIAGHLLDMVVEDMREKGISPLYLVSDHTGFYERYDWEFLCMVQGDDEPELTRMYIHR